MGQIDDQYVDDTRYDKEKAPEAGRKSDAKTAGGYADIALKDGKRILEWGRKLDTGSKTDVQFNDLSKTYAFGVAVFDNAQVRHAFSGVQKLAFQTGSAQPAATAQAPAPAQLPKTGGDSVFPLLQLAMAAVGSLGLGAVIRRVTHR